MRSVKFTDSEIDFLREKYFQEVTAAERYISNLKEIMRKMGIDFPGSSVTEEVLPVEKKKRGRKPKAVVVTPSEPKKRGRKPKVVTGEPQQPKKRGRKPKAILESDIIVPAYSLDITAPKRKNKKNNNRRRNQSNKSSLLNLAPLAKKRSVLDLLEKFPEMRAKVLPNATL